MLFVMTSPYSEEEKIKSYRRFPHSHLDYWKETTSLQKKKTPRNNQISATRRAVCSAKGRRRKRSNNTLFLYSLHQQIYVRENQGKEAWAEVAVVSSPEAINSLIINKATHRICLFSPPTSLLPEQLHSCGSEYRHVPCITHTQSGQPSCSLMKRGSKASLENQALFWRSALWTGRSTPLPAHCFHCPCWLCSQNFIALFPTLSWHFLRRSLICFVQ